MSFVSFGDEIVVADLVDKVTVAPSVRALPFLSPCGRASVRSAVEGNIVSVCVCLCVVLCAVVVWSTLQCPISTRRDTPPYR